jgi:hypothetical protein
VSAANIFDTTRNLGSLETMLLNDTQRGLILHHADRLLTTRAWPKTICPSEIARALSNSELETLNAATWRDTMGSIRQILWEKRASGEVEVMQKGEVVAAESLEDVKGPIRVRMVKR